MELLRKVLEGDTLVAARLMRGVEDEVPNAIEELSKVYLHAGRAHIVGVTGAPGAGKSTLIDSLIGIFREKDMTIGVIAVDPSSPFTGGAILGDRIRMQSRCLDKDVFIRSMANRGWQGGLSKATMNVIHVMDAMGKDIILVEAVGSGQAETDIAWVTDTTLVILTPGMGDEIQMLKAGILEIADIFVVNKADREGAGNVKVGLEATLQMKTCASGDWVPPVILTEATSGKGTKELAEEIIKHRAFLSSSGRLEKRRKERAKLELEMAIESCIKDYIGRADKNLLENLVDDLVQRKTNPRSAALKILDVLKSQ